MQNEFEESKYGTTIETLRKGIAAYGGHVGTLQAMLHNLLNVLSELPRANGHEIHFSVTNHNQFYHLLNQAKWVADDLRISLNDGWNPEK